MLQILNQLTLFSIFLHTLTEEEEGAIDYVFWGTFIFINLKNKFIGKLFRFISRFQRNTFWIIFFQSTSGFSIYMPLFGQILENEGGESICFLLTGNFFQKSKKEGVDLKVMHINWNTLIHFPNFFLKFF